MLEGGESLPYLTLLRRFPKQVLSVPKTRPSPLPYVLLVALEVVRRWHAKSPPYRRGKVLPVLHKAVKVKV